MSSHGKRTSGQADKRTCGQWFEDYDTLLEFATLWRALGGFGPVDSAEGNLDDVFYFLSKPWKWTDEYERWIALGAPNADSPVFAAIGLRQPFEVLQEESPTTPPASSWRLADAAAASIRSKTVPRGSGRAAAAKAR